MTRLFAATVLFGVVACGPRMKPDEEGERLPILSAAPDALGATIPPAPSVLAPPPRPPPIKQVGSLGSIPTVAPPEAPAPLEPTVAPAPASGGAATSGRP